MNAMQRFSDKGAKIVAGAVASYFAGSIKHYVVYILALVAIMFAISLTKVLTKK